MSDPQTVTFIGGPWDLHRVVMPDPLPHVYRVPVLADRWWRADIKEDDRLENVDVRAALYELMEEPGYRGTRYRIYVWRGTSSVMEIVRATASSESSDPEGGS